MLDRAYQQELKATLQRLPCRVVLPSEWRDYFSQHGPQEASPGHQRRFNRVNYRAKAVIDLGTSLPAVPREPRQHVVLMRDISRNGAGFLHVEQLYPGEKVKLSLVTGPILVQVTRCLRHNDRCYEVGAELCDSGRARGRAKRRARTTSGG